MISNVADSSPAFYQTWPFYAACVVVIALLARGITRFRLRRLERRNEQLRRMQRELEAKNSEVEAKNVEVEAKSEELQRFTYAVSHDLKSPLITIQGFLGYLERDLASGDAERIASDIRKIRGAAEKMQSLLGELLQLSRIGSVANTLEQVDVGQLAKEAVALVAGQIDARGVEVVIAPDL
ncbi:MAG: histidine kinase dimerization/phospho-acceptor domain-containing protein, partial [Acidobacteriota bacterium]